MVIIIDDDVSSALIAQAILEEQYFKVIIAHDVYQGLRLCAGLHRDLEFVLVELYLPDLSGFEIIEHIRYINKKIPVFGYSVLHDQEIINECENEGFDGYINKPVTFNSFKNIYEHIALPKNQRNFLDIRY